MTVDQRFRQLLASVGGWWLAATVVLVVVVATGVLWVAQDIQERRHIQQVLAAENSGIAFRIQAHLKYRATALQRMANRWSQLGKPERGAWEHDAANYVEDFKDFQALEWIDASYHVRWIVPLKGNEQAQGLDLAYEAHRRAALEAAKVSQEITMTRPINLVQGGKGFLAYCPIYHDNRFEGFILGVFRFDKLFEDIHEYTDENKYHAHVRVGQDWVLKRANDHHDARVERLAHHRKSITLYGVPWMIDLTPSDQTLSELRSSLKDLTLMIGIALGLLLVVLTRQAQVLRRRSVEVAKVNEKLEVEVTERKQAQNAVAESEAKVRAILDTAPDAIITINHDGCIETINTAGESIFGYTAQELRGNRVNMLMPSLYQEEHDGYLGAYLRTGLKKIIGVGREVEGLHKDGSAFPISLSVGEFKRAGRSYFTGIVQDISDRKRAEALLRASEKRFDLAVRGTSDGLWDWSIETDEVWYAPQFKAMLGYEGDEFPHTFTSFESHLHPEDKKDTLEAIRQHLEENQLYDVEFRLRDKGGEYEWFRARGIAHRDEVGNPIRMAGSIQDIHDQKRAQDEISRYAGDLWRAREEIRASQKRFELAVDGTSDGLWDWLDVTKEDEWWSPRFYELLGYRDGEVEASLSQFKKLLHPDDLNRTTEAMRVHLEEDEPFDIAYRLKTKPGPYRWFRARGKTVRDRSGKPLRMAGSIQDITERKHAEEELARWAEELEKSNKELDDFAYIASHDLKEPLRGIHNYATFLIEDYEDTIDEDGVIKLRTLQRLTQRMETLIDTLLHFSRVGRVDMAFEETDLNQILSEVVDSLHVTLDQGHIEVRTPTLLPTVLCDRARVSEVFRNLVTNAMKYNDKPDKWIEVGVADRPLGDGPSEADRGEHGDSPHVFYVRDNGVGIPEKHMASIFRIFKRLHGRDKFGGGTGAGLTIVKKIVERHGGRVWVESRHGQGATFKFTLGKAA